MPGEPLLVTANDYEIGLYNGDTGVVVDDGAGGLMAAFGRGGAPIPVPLVRLGAVRSLHAMTVHRSQGSQFDRITVLLPPATSPLGTRETLYTAVTRAKEHVRVIGSAEALVEAVGRPAARATGLRERLSGGLDSTAPRPTETSGASVRAGTVACRLTRHGPRRHRTPDLVPGLSSERLTVPP